MKEVPGQIQMNTLTFLLLFVGEWVIICEGPSHTQISENTMLAQDTLS